MEAEADVTDGNPYTGRGYMEQDGARYTLYCKRCGIVLKGRVAPDPKNWGEWAPESHQSLATKE